jgi:hypothetical protein
MQLSSAGSPKWQEKYSISLRFEGRNVAEKSIADSLFFRGEIVPLNEIIISMGDIGA